MASGRDAFVCQSDSDPAGDAQREVQSLIDSRGRIVGWFSWVSDRALVRAMNRLWTLAAAVAAALAPYTRPPHQCARS